MREVEEQILLLRAAKSGDESAKMLLFERNSPLIKSIIRRFINKGVEYDDLYQIASIGFLKAINNFDESFDVKFSTYTVPMIIGEIKRYIRDNGAIKVSRTMKMLANKINRYIDEYRTVNSESPPIEAVADKFGISKDEVVVAMDSARMPLSIYDKFDEDDEGSELLNKIADTDGEEKLIDKIHISNIIEKLDERERRIVILRYFRDKTQSEVAESLGVSQVQISRMETKIIEKLKTEYDG